MNNNCPSNKTSRIIKSGKLETTIKLTILINLIVMCQKIIAHKFVIYMYLVVRWRRTITVGLSNCKLIRQDVYRFILWIRASLIDIHYSCKVHVRSYRSEWKLWMDDFFSDRKPLTWQCIISIGIFTTSLETCKCKDDFKGFLFI